MSQLLPFNNRPLGPVPEKTPETVEVAENNFCNELHYSPAVTLFELEKQYLILALAYHNNNKYQAAESLGIAVKTLFNRLHKYGIFDEYKLHFKRDPRGRKAVNETPTT